MKLKTKVCIAGLMMAAMCGAASAQSLELWAVASAGTAYVVAVAPLSTTGEFVTAILNGNNDLEAIAWKNNTNTRSITRLGSWTGGPLGGSVMFGPDLAVAGISNNRFVTAEINDGGFLELTSFQVNSNGTITLLGNTDTSSVVDTVAITALDAQRVVTVTTDTTQATVTTWIVNSNGSVTAQATPAILQIPSSSVAVAAMSSTQIVVAQNNGNNPHTGMLNVLTLTSLSVASNGALAQESVLYSAQYGNATGPPRMSVASLGGGALAVDCMDDGGYPILNFWNISASGLITLLSSSQNYDNPATTLSVANMGGYAFTIDNAEATPNLYETAVWGQSQGTYQMLAGSTVGGCTNYCYWGTAAAAALEGEVATATTGSSTLFVEVWLFLP